MSQGRSKRVSHGIASDRINDLQDKLQEIVVEEEVAVDEPKDDKKIKDIRNLLFIGRKTINVEVEGFTFTLQTLKNKENELVIRRVLMLSDSERILAVKNHTLAMAIRSVNGYNLEDLFENTDNNEVDSLTAKLAVLDELDSNLVEYLFGKYAELKSDLVKSFENDEVSEAIKK